MAVLRRLADKAQALYALFLKNSEADGIDSTPVGLEDVSTFPALFAELSRRGWTEEELRKLAGENVLRVMREAEAVARRLQRTRPPSTATIEQLDRLTG